MRDVVRVRPDARSSDLGSSRHWPAGLVALACAAALAVLAGCGSGLAASRPSPSPQQVRAWAMWEERCKKSGEFIHKTVEGVEGIYLVNLRTRYNHGESAEDQFALTDPYGNDVVGDGYISNFLRDSFYYADKSKLPVGFPPRTGYRYVEAVDPKDGKLYRYTGRVEEPWRTDQRYATGTRIFVMTRHEVTARTARYGIKFEDISTREEREHWIAGSSLKVIDLETNEVLAERVGYMVDWAQGARGGGRSPWLFAADNACPAFAKRLNQPQKNPVRGAGDQTRQTPDFAEQVLKPLP